MFAIVRHARTMGVLLGSVVVLGASVPASGVSGVSGANEDDGCR